VKYKGSTPIDTGAFYCPYVPLFMVDVRSTQSWQEMLAEARLRGKNKEGVEAFMQDFFPGPYTIQEYYNVKLGRFDYKLVFEDPRQETLWRLKYPC